MDGRGSPKRLTERSLRYFEGPTLFDRIARTVCGAGCLARKELYEAWEVARRVRRRWRGGRVVDLAAGHGLLAYLMLILDDTSPTALAVDRRITKCGRTLAPKLEAQWPRLRGRVELLEGRLERVELTSDDIVVSVHACGGLTDLVIDRAITARARVAVLPCCHSFSKQDDGGFAGWLDTALAIDVNRAARLKAAGYKVRTQVIPGEITQKNRLLMASPREFVVAAG
jgi:hypothetical protein